MTVNGKAFNGEIMKLTMGMYEICSDTERPGDCMALYIYFLYLNLQQKSNPVEVEEKDMCKELKWGKTRLHKAIKILEDKGFIEECDKPFEKEK